MAAARPPTKLTPKRTRHHTTQQENQQPFDTEDLLLEPTRTCEHLQPGWRALPHQQDGVCPTKAQPAVSLTCTVSKLQTVSWWLDFFFYNRGPKKFELLWPGNLSGLGLPRVSNLARPLLTVFGTVQPERRFLVNSRSTPL